MFEWIELSTGCGDKLAETPLGTYYIIPDDLGKTWRSIVPAEDPESQFVELWSDEHLAAECCYAHFVGKYYEIRKVIQDSDDPIAADLIPRPMVSNGRYAPFLRIGAQDYTTEEEAVKHTNKYIGCVVNLHMRAGQLLDAVKRAQEDGGAIDGEILKRAEQLDECYKFSSCFRTDNRL